MSTNRIMDGNGDFSDSRIGEKSPGQMFDNSPRLRVDVRTS